MMVGDMLRCDVLRSVHAPRMIFGTATCTESATSTYSYNGMRTWWATTTLTSALFMML